MILKKHGDLNNFIKSLCLLRDAKVLVTAEIFNTLISHQIPELLALSYALSTQCKIRIKDEGFLFTDDIKKQSKRIITAFEAYIQTGNTESIQSIKGEVLRGQLKLIAQELSILKDNETLDLASFNLDQSVCSSSLSLS